MSTSSDKVRASGRNWSELSMLVVTTQYKSFATYSRAVSVKCG